MQPPRLLVLARELRRRRVVRVATVYLVSGLGVVYAADTILPRLSAPDWTVAAVIVLVGLGFFLAVSLAWAFDLTPEGMVRTAPVEPAPAPAGGATHVPGGGGAPAPVLASGPDAASPAAAAEPGLDRRAIAVLPFENMSEDRASDHFSDGISEEIINALAQLPELRVAGRTSAFSFKGRHEDLRSIGRKLAVGTVLEGSVRQVGSRVRITAQLIDTNDGYHLWSERYDRDLHDIFQVQDEIARAIAETLAVKLGARGSTLLVAPHPDDPEAYELFLTGRHYVSQLAEPGFTLAVEAYRGAIARAPDYALAWAGIAEAELIRGALLDEPYQSAPSRARAAALRALEVDDRVAEAHATLGGILTYYDLDWDGAERAFQRALELSPGSAWARTWYSELLAFTGRADEAVAEARRAQEIEPLASLFRWNVIQDLWLAGRLDEVDEEARRTLQLFPDAYFVHYFLGLAAWCRGDEEGAIGGLRKTIDALGDLPLASSYLAAVYHHFGRREEGDRVFEGIRRRAAEEHVSAGAFVLVHVARGDTGEAIRWLREGRTRKDGFFCQVKVMLRATPLELDPRIAEELTRLGFR